MSIRRIKQDIADAEHLAKKYGLPQAKEFLRKAKMPYAPPLPWKRTPRAEEPKPPAWSWPHDRPEERNPKSQTRRYASGGPRRAGCVSSPTRQSRLVDPSQASSRAVRENHV